MATLRRSAIQPLQEDVVRSFEADEPYAGGSAVAVCRSEDFTVISLENGAGEDS